MTELDPNAIAIIGMAGRFPGAATPAALWSNVCAGVESVTRLTDDELLAAGARPEDLTDPNYVKACAFLEHPDLFDAPFFDISPREAELMDPQQRVFLECAWSAFEDAGYDVSRFDGAIGVFAGAGKNHYYANHLLANPSVLESMGPVAVTIASEKDFVATRVAYKLDLSGPSVSVQTACSTSLVAVHMACQSLMNGESDMVLAGGASISSFVKLGYGFIDGGIFSPDGHLRAFDAKAGGQVGGNGVAAVVLKRLVDAVEDGDTVHAVIKGSALNNDGDRKVSFNAPGVDGQAAVIAEAMEVADVDPSSIGYVECHGTGTNLGDPIEVAALTQAYRGAGAKANGFCALSSLKTNVGHLDAAAGVSGLIKAAFAIEHGKIPASLHFETPNPALELETSPFFVNAKLSDWPVKTGPRRAGVSSFGMGGTNAHVVLEQGPRVAEPVSDASGRSPELIVLSARSEAALDAHCEQLADHLAGDANASRSLADTAHTTQVGRKAFSVRRAIACVDRESAVRLLRDRGGSSATCTDVALAKGRSVAFMFSGQGTQFANMARGVYETEPVFRAELDRCCDALTPLVGRDLRELMFPAGDAGAVDEASRELELTQYTQPALFAVEYALVKQLAAWGLEPAAMLGHSIGEYVAACLAGVFSLDDALKLVAARGRLIGGLPGQDDASAGGGMLAVPLPEVELEAMLAELDQPGVSIAVINAPELCVVAGPMHALETVRKALRANRVAARKLHTSHAFHSALMDPILAEFEAAVRDVKLSAPSMRVVSCTTGTWLSDAEACDPAYWVRHLREPVRFAAGVETLVEAGHVLLEVGPGQALMSLARLTNPEAAVIASSRHPKAEADDQVVLRQALGTLWCEGVRVDWSALRGGESRRRVPLPTYPFEHRRYWIDPEPNLSAAPVRKHTDPAKWLYAPSWRRGVATPVSASTATRVLLIADEGGIADALAKSLGNRGADVEIVRCGPDCDLTVAASYARLFASGVPALIVHLAAADAVVGDELDDFDRAQETGFFSVLALAQAVAEHASDTPVTIQIVTRGMQGVFDELCDPERATVLGVCKAVNAELGSISCRSIDLEPDGAADEVEALVAELAREEPVVALRTGKRWLPSFERIPAVPDPIIATTPRDKPVVLITGGLGGIGLALAEGLARDRSAKLVLLGRTAFTGQASDWRTEAVQRIEAAGGEVLTIAADIASQSGVRAAVEQACERFGAIHGVIHAAGLPGGGLLTLKTREDAAAVLAPKVRGTRVLAAALADQPLDFFVVCSSLATALEGVGQVDYFAANAFLDAYAIHRDRSSATRVVSIGWEAWNETGMATSEAVPEELRTGRAKALALGLTSDEGRDVFGRALATGLPNVFVSTHELEARRTAQELETQALAGDAGEAGHASVEESSTTSRSNSHPRPSLDTPLVEPSNDTQQALASIWSDLIGVAPVGVNDDFFALGGNSLLLMQVSARLRSTLGVTISMRELFDTPTVAQLADRMEAMQLLDDLDGDVASAATETEEFKL